MFSKSKSGISGSQSFMSQNSLKKKKHAPPRPPQPSASKLLTSQSFGTADELSSRQQTGFTIANRPSFNTNLIDFSAPVPASIRPVSQPTDLIASTQPDPPEFRYRVAASIFYIKSPLKNSSCGAPESNPFSPPRPSAQSLSTTGKPSALRPIPSSITPANTSTKYISNPTIIKSQGTTAPDAQTQQPSHFISSTTAQSAQYGNIPTQWDEPPKRAELAPYFPPQTMAFRNPTVIKPAPPPKKVGLTAKSFPVPAPVTRPPYAEVPEPRVYYDEPPGLEDDDDDDDDDDFDSKPMPNVPPPPPPSDMEVQEWDEGDVDVTLPYTYKPRTGFHDVNEADRAYAIALYDYVPEAEGDLALQMGDLVYLTRKIDDSWLFGVCGGVEGMFPTNYVNVVVPLSEEELKVPELSHVESDYAYHYANVLYPFTAETESDLSLQMEDVVGILGRINEDWLYGDINGSRGQFPTTFVSPVPSDLPIITL